VEHSVDLLLSEVREQLLAMVAKDQQVRAELLATGALFDGYQPRMAAVHLAHAERLETIIETVGWPVESQVGRDGAEAAWLILQHAIGSPGLQRACLPLLQEAAKDGGIPAWQAAYLEDRICVFEGRPQRFGTHLDWDGNGVLSPHPIADPDNVDRRRAEVGLGPLALHVDTLRERAAGEGQQQPADFADYLEKKFAWARSVGWQ
jgi:hypothetical protein